MYRITSRCFWSASMMFMMQRYFGFCYLDWALGWMLFIQSKYSVHPTQGWILGDSHPYPPLPLGIPKCPSPHAFWTPKLLASPPFWISCFFFLIQPSRIHCFQGKRFCTFTSSQKFLLKDFSHTTFYEASNLHWLSDPCHHLHSWLNLWQLRLPLLQSQFSNHLNSIN